MFTGIVEELGRCASHEGARIRIAARTVLEGTEVGDSIAVNGTCLTVVVLGDGWWATDVSEETTSRSTVGTMSPGDPVNLERAVRLDQRMGGHIVQGHVDGIGEILAPAPDLRVRIPRPLMRYCVEKGSITVDGVSLTVFDLDDDEGTFRVAVIPHTADVTTLGTREPGDRVNIEVDVMAKYVERLLAPHLA